VNVTSTNLQLIPCHRPRPLHSPHRHLQDGTGRIVTLNPALSNFPHSPRYLARPIDKHEVDWESHTVSVDAGRRRGQ
jgi:hypothetical protein